MYTYVTEHSLCHWQPSKREKRKEEIVSDYFFFSIDIPPDYISQLKKVKFCFPGINRWKHISILNCVCVYLPRNRLWRNSQKIKMPIVSLLFFSACRDYIDTMAQHGRCQRNHGRINASPRKWNEKEGVLLLLLKERERSAGRNSP